METSKICGSSTIKGTLIGTAALTIVGAVIAYLATARFRRATSFEITSYHTGRRLKALDLSSTISSQRTYALSVASYTPNRPPHVDGVASTLFLNQLSKEVSELQTDVVLFQRLSPKLFESLNGHLEPLGYKGIFTQAPVPSSAVQRAQGLHRGFATFYRADQLTVKNVEGVSSMNAAGLNGVLAQVVDFELRGKQFSLINMKLSMVQRAINPLKHLGVIEIDIMTPRARVPMFLTGDLSRWVAHRNLPPSVLGRLSNMSLVGGVHDGVSRAPFGYALAATRLEPVQIDALYEFLRQLEGANAAHSSAIDFHAPLFARLLV